jgi:3-deoxy-D-manno-octulosonic-acid transferase
MQTTDSQDPLSARLLLAAYGRLTAVLQPVLRLHLQRRIKRGKEDPVRWREKLAQPSAARGEGRLVWLHAVGLGETLALRGVVEALHQRLPEARFLITSSTRASAEVLAENPLPMTTHQFLPLDTPRHVRAFLDHWQPDLVIWSEQELWPGFVMESHRRRITQVLINARMTADGFARRRRIGTFYRALYGRFALICAQNKNTLEYLQSLGAKSVNLVGRLKSSAPPLRCDAGQLDVLKNNINGRFVWVAASTHPQDEAIALAAQTKLSEQVSDALLVLVPRYPERADDAIAAGQALGLSISRAQGGGEQVWVVDRFGALGLWYRLARAAFIGGTNSEVQGHNPWEAAILGRPVLHGPHCDNFQDDYAALSESGGACLVKDAAELLQNLLQEHDLQVMGEAAEKCAKAQTLALSDMFDQLAELAT